MNRYLVIDRSSTEVTTYVVTEDNLSSVPRNAAFEIKPLGDVSADEAEVIRQWVDI